MSSQLKKNAFVVSPTLSNAVGKSTVKSLSSQFPPSSFTTGTIAHQQLETMGFRTLLRGRANSLRLSRPRLRSPRTLITPRQSSMTMTNDNSENETNQQTDENDESLGPVQGPSTAPTEAGVSTVGLSDLETKFLESAYKSNVKGIQEAIENGVDVNTSDINGRTCLHFCAGNGLNTLVRELGAKGAIVDKQDLLGLTPLHMAAGYKRVESVRALLDLGADANVASNDRRLPVEIAEQMLEKAPKRRFFMENQDHTKLREIVSLLDDATELEDDPEMGEQYRYVDETEDDDDRNESNGNQGTGQGDAMREKVLNDFGESTEKVGDATFTVRVKSSKEPKSESTSAASNLDDVDIKITVKEPGSSNK